MGEFIAQSWDLEKPLWEMVIVENYRDKDGAECALIVRGFVLYERILLSKINPFSRHHTLADGQGKTSNSWNISI